MENLRVWREYNDADSSIKSVIKTIVSEVFFQTLQNHHTGYAAVRSLDILTHLHAKYGMLEDKYIQATHCRISCVMVLKCLKIYLGYYGFDHTFD